MAFLQSAFFCVSFPSPSQRDKGAVTLHSVSTCKVWLQYMDLMDSSLRCARVKFCVAIVIVNDSSVHTVSTVFINLQCTLTCSIDLLLMLTCSSCLFLLPPSFI